MFFWCQSGEDGTSVEPLTDRQLAARLKEVASGDWGAVTFLQKIPDSDKGSWDYAAEGVVIIEGEIIVPKAKQRVTEYTVERKQP